MKQINYSLLLLALLAGACKKEATSANPAAAKPAAAKPVALFSAPASAESNIPLQVINQSTDAVGYLWTWGDGTTSTDMAPPAHAYDTFGKVRIRLAVSSPAGTDTTSQVVQIAPGGAPASVLTSAVGTYRGRLYSTNYGASTTTRVRDTTMQLTKVSTRTVHIFNTDFNYMVGTYISSSQWLGHAPQRRNVMFTYSRNVLQLESAGDSVYFYVYSGGVVQAADSWKFYGKKQP